MFCQSNGILLICQNRCSRQHKFKFTWGTAYKKYRGKEKKQLGSYKIFWPIYMVFWDLYMYHLSYNKFFYYFTILFQNTTCEIDLTLHLKPNLISTFQFKKDLILILSLFPHMSSPSLSSSSSLSATTNRCYPLQPLQLLVFATD